MASLFCQVIKLPQDKTFRKTSFRNKCNAPVSLSHKLHMYLSKTKHLQWEAIVATVTYWIHIQSYHSNKTTRKDCHLTYEEAAGTCRLCIQWQLHEYVIQGEPGEPTQDRRGPYWQIYFICPLPLPSSDTLSRYRIAVHIFQSDLRLWLPFPHGREDQERLQTVMQI